MKKSVAVSNLSFHDAISNLTTIAEMTIDKKNPIGVVKRNKFVIDDEDFSYKTIEWLLPEEPDEIISNVKESYRTILEYFQEIYQKDLIDFNEYKCKKGFEAIMSAAVEAANKIDHYLELFDKKVEKIRPCQEKEDLDRFYNEKIAPKFAETAEQAYDEELSQNQYDILFDIEKSGIKDFETLRKDKEYELFSIYDEEEKPLFNANIIRNIKLICSGEEIKKASDLLDPLVQVRSLIDRDFQISAKQILNLISPALHKYFAKKLFAKKKEVFFLINSSVYALMLAANPQNRQELTKKKNSLEYFKDFQFFFRNLLSSEDYIRIITYSKDYNQKEVEVILELAGSIAKSLYTHGGGIKEHIIGFVHHLILLGEKQYKSAGSQKKNLWQIFVEENDKIELVLSMFPNGPLFKLLDVIINEAVGFDPLLQYNIPQKLFTVFLNKTDKIDILKAPTPTKQQVISKAIVIEEFKTFILAGKEKSILINLQSRTSWKDKARVLAVENLQKRAEIKKYFSIFALDKETDFYHQSGPYLNLNDAKAFFHECKKELLNSDHALLVQDKEFSGFIDETMKMIHQLFFRESQNLSRAERQDFIEILYLFITLKLIEMIEPRYFGYICKDACDTSATQNFMLYAFLKIITQEAFNKKDQDLMRWLIYSNAFLIRERSVDTQKFLRAMSAIARLDEKFLLHKAQLLKKLSNLFNPSFLKNISVANY